MVSLVIKQKIKIVISIIIQIEANKVEIILFDSIFYNDNKVMSIKGILNTGMYTL